MTEKKILGGTRVLLVEDNLANQKVALAMLSYLGATSVVAGSGEEAVKIFADCRANVVLMDCQMPTMDGYQTTRIIRKMEKEKGLKATPVIALTANAMHKDRQLCLDAGMDDYLTKPIEYELLGKAILKNMALSAEQAGANTVATASPPTAVACGEKPPSGIPSGLDHGVLAQLKGVCELPELYEQILSIYLVESKSQISDLDEAYQAVDGVLLAEVAHGLKSCSRNIGARLLGQLLEDLEYTAKSGVPAPSETDFLYRQTLAEYERVTLLIEEEINAPSARAN
ncbi:response regulator [Porticoccus sp.]